MSYQQKMLDPRWQKKRLQVMEKAQWRCQLCFEDRETLNVHHKHYISGRSPWEYEDDQLVVLCKNCHETVHEKPDPLAEIISRLPLDGPFSRSEAAYLLAGWLDIKPKEPILDFAIQPRALMEAGKEVNEIVRAKFERLEQELRCKK